MRHALPKPFARGHPEDLDRMIDLNVRGVFIAPRAALKHLGTAAVSISIGSCVGRAEHRTPGRRLYFPQPRAPVKCSRKPSREVGPARRGITVNTSSPAPIDTDLNPAAGEWATPQIANTALKNDTAMSKTSPRWWPSSPARGRELHHGRQPDRRRRTNA